MIARRNIRAMLADPEQRARLLSTATAAVIAIGRDDAVVVPARRRVGYARKFLKSIGCDATDALWSRMGELIGPHEQLQGYSWVRWDDASGVTLVLDVNLAAPRTAAFVD